MTFLYYMVIRFPCSVPYDKPNFSCVLLQCDSAGVFVFYVLPLKSDLLLTSSPVSLWCGV